MPSSASPPSAVNSTTASAPSDEGLLDLGDLHDLGPLGVGGGARREQHRERRGRRERGVRDADHPLAHHDHVGAARDRLARARRRCRRAARGTSATSCRGRARRSPRRRPRRSRASSASPCRRSSPVSPSRSTPDDAELERVGQVVLLRQQQRLAFVPRSRPAAGTAAARPAFTRSRFASVAVRAVGLDATRSRGRPARRGARGSRRAEPSSGIAASSVGRQPRRGDRRRGEHDRAPVGGPHALEHDDRRRPRRGRAPPPRSAWRRRCGSRSARSRAACPAGAIASVTPKFTSRLLRSRGRCVA